MEDDAALWRAFKKGDRKAYEQIFDEYFPAMRQYGRSLQPDKEVLNDCIQDVFLKIWQSKENLSDVISIKAYLFRALKMRLITVQEKELQKTAVFEKEPVELSYESFLVAWQDDEEAKQKLARVVQKLTKRQQEAIHLRFYEQMEYEQIGQVMQVSYQGVRNLIYHALRFLRENLAAMLLWLMCLQQY